MKIALPDPTTPLRAGLLGTGAALFGVAGVSVLLGLAALVPWQALAPTPAASGRVIDVESGLPIRDAIVTSGQFSTSSGQEGTFRLSGASLLGEIEASAPGYVPGVVRRQPFGTHTLNLTPREMMVSVRDLDGRPLDGVPPAMAGARVAQVAPGTFALRPASSELTLSLQTDAHKIVARDLAADGTVRVTLASWHRGTVRDAATGAPIRGARVVGESVTPVGADGAFELSRAPTDGLTIIAAGYKPVKIAPGSPPPYDVRLDAHVARGLYLSFYGVAEKRLRDVALALVERGRINTLVIDVKGDRGLLAYPTNIELARKIGSAESPTVDDMAGLLSDLKQRGIYCIARLVVFKDDKLATNGEGAGKDVAVRDERDGGVWRDGEGLGWADPLRKDVWDYNAAIIREVAALGFDEIQLDYVRFPSDTTGGGSVDAARYAEPVDEARRIATISEFVSSMRQAANQSGALLSIDIFGYVAWSEQDQGIGQTLEPLADAADILSPMVYPSTFRSGLPGGVAYPTVVSRPYEVVALSLIRARERLGERPAVLRPWLQYFDDYPWQTGRPYTEADIAAQIQAAHDGGATGWILWDPSNTYTRGVPGRP
ncbi:MAG: putative glycoside hydrolase [Chloroflexota bacterium]